MADFYISGVFKNTQDEITHVMLHGDAGNNEFYNGNKVTEAYVIRQLEALNTVQVITWNYTLASWYSGDFVKVVKGQFRKYIRSHANNTVNDNLDNLINFAGIVT